MRLFSDWDYRVAAALFLLSLGVYALTASPTISFWDCGEFVASAHTMGIPHQPGTPLYVLVGRVFSLLPLGLGVAFKLNLMSAFFAALAVVFMYLTALRMQRDWAEERELPSPPWLVRTAAACGALFLAFSYTFWNSAIEAEVYSLAAFVLAVSAFLSMKWYEVRAQESSASFMLIIVYIMGLSIGFHMGSFLVFPGILLLVLLSPDRALRATDILIVFAAMAAFVLSTQKLPGLLVSILLVGSLVAATWRAMTWGTTEENPRSRWFAYAGIGLFFLGLSVHLLMLVRAAQDPMINQTDPTTFDRLMTVLQRLQYPPRNMLEREAPLWWQLQHLWGSAVWQEGSSMRGIRAIGYLQQFTFFSNPGFLDRFVPLGLWLYGLFCQLRGNWRVFSSFFFTLLVNSIGLLILLNFTNAEVRDRDYFYFGAFQFAALFLALGVGGLLRSVWLGIRAYPWHRMAMRAAGAFLIFIPLMPVVFAPMGHSKWFEHDRSRDVVARNYGYNMLNFLPQDAILFTNGDNDTFPLWYLQLVEGIRPDVRVVNLSLINLPWYIKQLRDYEPSVPIRWNDAQIEGEEPIVYKRWRTVLQPQMLPDGTAAWVRDITVWHIVRENNWDREVFFAVTIPEENIQDFVPYLSMEGLVHRLTPDRSESGLPVVDTAKLWENLSQNFDWTGVLNEDGEFDRTIFRDHQTRHLLHNYPAGASRVGYYAAVADSFDFALEALEFAYRLEPSFGLMAQLLPIVYLQNGQMEEALDAGRRLRRSLADPTENSVELGEALLSIDERRRALEWAEEILQEEPESLDYLQLYVKTLIANDRRGDAERVVQEYVDRTGDPDASAELERYREAMRDSAAIERGGE